MAVSQENTPSVARSLLRIAGPAVVIVAIVSISLGAWWLKRDNRTVAGTITSVPAGTSSQAADAPDRAQALLAQARLALKERRLLAPAGNNAIEFYLQIQDIEATHAAARQALLELIPPATADVEGVIAAGELAEAQRQLQLLRRMGASELTLGPLQTQLDDARAAIDRAQTLAEQAAETTDPAPPAAATVPPSAPATAVSATVDTRAAPVVATAMPEKSATAAVPGAATSRPSPPRPPPTPPASAPASVVAAPATAAVQEPRQIIDVRPAYPVAAVKRRIEGWVELEVAIAADGNVAEVSVVGSEPANIFDREAVRAAQRWRFEPRRENGIAVASRVRKTLTFKLTAG